MWAGRVRRSENGSIAITMGILLIIANLSVLVLARTLATLHQVRLGQDFAASLGSADGALADALFQIDQSPAATLSGTGSVNGHGTYRYVATKVDTYTYDVRAKGTIGASSHAIEATVARSQAYPYALFVDQALSLPAGGTYSIYSFDTAGGAHTGAARIGSNHGIVVGPGASAGDGQDAYTPFGSCSGCAQLATKPGPYAIPAPAVPPGTTLPCPVAGLFTGFVNGSAGLPIVCDTDITFSGGVTVSNGPVIIYVTGAHTISFSGADVNHAGGAGDLQVMKTGTGAVTASSGLGAGRFNGVLYAPASSLTLGAGETLLGSVTVGTLKVAGAGLAAPAFTLAYDTRVASLPSTAWHVTSWHEVPTTAVGL